MVQQHVPLSKRVHYVTYADIIRRWSPKWYFPKANEQLLEQGELRAPSLLLVAMPFVARSVLCSVLHVNASSKTRTYPSYGKTANRELLSSMHWKHEMPLHIRSTPLSSFAKPPREAPIP